MESTIKRLDYMLPGRLSDFDPDDFIEEARRFLLEAVSPGDKVALSASGGVDSTTVAYLIQKCLGGVFYPFFIDDGFRRIIRGREESEITAEIFKDFPSLRILDMRSKYFSALEGIDGGEKKREIFRRLYTETSNAYIREICAGWIADGTIAPDIIETEGKVKTQHNVMLPYAINKLELLASLYKPHVRKVALRLGAPPEAAFRIPCPGPAQLIRVVGPVNPRKLEIAKIATDFVERETESYCRRKWGVPFRYDEATGIRTPFQMFGVALEPDMEEVRDVSEFIKMSTGRKVRCFKMRAMTTYILKKEKRPENPLYANVLWVKSEDPSASLEELLPVRTKLFEQFGYPRILLEFCEFSGDFPAAIRVVESPDAVTADPMKIDPDALLSFSKTIAEKSGASRVAYDLSCKPPATIEFE